MGLRRGHQVFTYISILLIIATSEVSTLLLKTASFLVFQVHIASAHKKSVTCLFFSPRQAFTTSTKKKLNSWLAILSNPKHLSNKTIEKLQWGIEINVISCFKLITNFTIFRSRPLPLLKMNTRLDSIVSSHPKENFHFERIVTFRHGHHLYIHNSTYSHQFA